MLTKIVIHETSLYVIASYIVAKHCIRFKMRQHKKYTIITEKEHNCKQNHSELKNCSGARKGHEDFAVD